MADEQSPSEPQVDRRRAIQLTTAAVLGGTVGSIPTEAAAQMDLLSRKPISDEDKKAAITYTFEKVPVDLLRSLGETIYRVAVSDEELFKFRQAPTEYLGRAVPKLKDVLESNAVLVLRDQPGTKDQRGTWHVIVPEAVREQAEFNNQAQYDAYLVELGFVTIMGCK
jgi:hypothetical protein